MKQTIFNASLGESMNLVTDEYINASLEDYKKKNNYQKILGLLMIVLLMFFVTLISTNYDKQGIKIFSIKLSLIEGILLAVASIATIQYMVQSTTLKNRVILSYYFFNRSMFFLSSLLILQLIVFSLASSSIVASDFYLSLFYVFIYASFITYCTQKFIYSTFKALYSQQNDAGNLVRMLNLVLMLSRRYGWIFILFLFFFRSLFFDVEHLKNDSIHTIIDLLVPLMGIPFIFLLTLLGADHFQGYYLQKYLEEYRKLSGYSLKEWYGKKSKRYKESMDK